MIPYLDDKYEMLRMLRDAIKGVYASVYFRDSKAYMQATSNVIEDVYKRQGLHQATDRIMQRDVSKLSLIHILYSLDGIAQHAQHLVLVV